MFLYLVPTVIEAISNARITSRSSCKDIPENSPSGYYWIQTKNHTIPVQVYCDMMSRNCNCNSTGGWARIANLDMTDPNQNCPNGFRLVNRTEPPLRLCGRPGNEFTGHVTATFPTHGIEYTHVCGRVIGYQFGNTDAFLAYFSSRFTLLMAVMLMASSSLTDNHHDNTYGLLLLHLMKLNIQVIPHAHA